MWTGGEAIVDHSSQPISTSALGWKIDCVTLIIIMFLFCYNKKRCGRVGLCVCLCACLRVRVPAGMVAAAVRVVVVD